MKFRKVFEIDLRLKQRKYKMFSISDTGVVLYVPKYQPVVPYVRLSMDVFLQHTPRVHIWGWPDFFKVKDPCTVPLGDNLTLEVAKNTVVVNELLCTECTEPRVEILLPFTHTMLSHEDWRKMRMEMDELFLMQGIKEDKP